MLIYSPLEELRAAVFAQKQLRVFIKRDDMIHPYISGNKWRKLKYTLLKAREENKNHLVTFGGAWSNHLLATACASAKFGFKSTGFVRGEPVENLVLSLCSTFGMELVFTSRESYRDKQRLYHTQYSNSENTYFIDEGGAGPEAVKGCAELIAELPEQFDHIFCACGTGTTAAGIAKGISMSGSSACLHAVPVLKDDGFILKAIEKYNDLPVNTVVHPGYHFGGYGKTTPELIRFIRTVASTSGILTDPVYTGKALYALYDLIEKDHFSPGETIIFIHTGGLTGIAGKLADFAKI